ncbi:restriction endonuclease [Paracidovorax avenae]|uniref:restriction endonuclease subunit S n=1 Tax=Paracidovorax avenae TaxID=80867 RepID=UPI000D222AA2|nr:restriction endonuclease subunit S [Paracidovorax avenae]AVS86855.1 restriction endonuclease [Paracidovorax avenae]
MLLSNMELLATAPGGVAKLRELILTLAVQGKLVPQDPADEPAGVLLQKIRAEKDRLIAEGKIKRDKQLAEIAEGEKPFGLPLGWAWTSLATIGVINPRNDAPDDTLASFVQMSSIPAEFSAAHVSEPRPWKDIKSGFTQFAEGDVGVAKITPCFENGKSTVFQNLCNGIGAGTTELHIVRPLSGIERRYVLLFVKTPAFLKEGEAVMTGSAGQKRLPRSYFECTPFPLPPLAEQSRIVTRVEALMRLCDALEAKGQLEATQHAQLVSTLLGTLTASTTPEELAENWQRVAQHFDLLLDRPEAIDALEQTLLQLAVRGLLVPQDPTDEPASALLQKIRAEKDRLIATGQIKQSKPLPLITDEEKPFELPVGWEWVRINDLAEVQGGIQKTQLRTPVKQHFPYLRVANVQRDALRLDEIERFELTMEELERWRLLAGDLLIVEGNGSAEEIGRCAVWNGAIDPCVYQNHLIRVRCFQQDCMAFIKLFLNAPSGAEEMKRLAITTSGLYNLSVGKIRNYAVPMPPLAEQSRIVTCVTALRRLCADLRQRLAEREAVQAHLAEALVDSLAA